MMLIGVSHIGVKYQNEVYGMNAFHIAAGCLNSSANQTLGELEVLLMRRRCLVSKILRAFIQGL